MKTFLVRCWVMLGLGAGAWAQQPVPPPASQDEVNTGADGFKYVTPATLSGYSLNQSTGSISAATATNIAVAASEIRDTTLSNVLSARLIATNGLLGTAYTNADTVVSNALSARLIATNANLQPLDSDLTALAGLGDPGADRLLFWDDSASSMAYLTLGTGLAISGTTITASGGTGGTGMQNPATADFDVANYALRNVDTIYGNDAAHGSELSLHSEDSDSTIKLYNFDSGNGIRYASQVGHWFTGPVTFNDGVTAAAWSFTSVAATEVYPGLTNVTAMGTDANGKMVAGSGQVAGNVFGDRAVWNGSAWEDDSRWIHLENEFLLASAVGYPSAAFGTGTGAGISAVDTTSNRVGVVALSAGTTATGYYGSAYGGASIRAFTWGQGEEMITDLTCYVDTLSDNTENFAFQFGYSESQITNAPADGVFWQYSNGTNSGNWQIVSRNSAGSTNVYDIGTNVVARRWYALRLKTATDGTSAAYLDGVLVQSGIAATSGQVIPLFRINKAAGTTDRTVRADFYRWSIRRATTRYQ